MMKTTLTALCVAMMATGAAFAAVSTDTSLTLMNNSPNAVTFQANQAVLNNGMMSSTVAAGQKEVHNIRTEVLSNNFGLLVAASQKKPCALEKGTNWSDTNLTAEVKGDGTCSVSSAMLIPGKTERQSPSGHKSNL